MDVIDYNGVGRWSRSAIQERYTQYVGELGIVPRDLSALEHSERGRDWVYPLMQKVIEGIEAGDSACTRIGIEFMEDDTKFPFGKVLKSNTARALRRAILTEEQKRRIRHHVFSLLRNGHIPHEFREYAKLVRKVGYEMNDLPECDRSNPHVERFRSYFEAALRQGS